MGNIFDSNTGTPPQGAEARLPTGFLAYPSLPPSIPPTIRAAIEAINKTQNAAIRSWEELQVNGKYVVPQIDYKLVSVIEHLVQLSFLGVEVSPDVFAYADEPRELKKNRVLSERFIADHNIRRYQINPPFRSYLEIAER